MKLLDIAPPQDVDAERSVLGAILLNNEALDYAVEILGVGTQQWYVAAHREIWGAMLAIGDTGTPIDVVTLADELGGRLDSVGGPAYIAELTTATPTSANVEHYARIVRNTATLRRLAEAGKRVYQQAFDRDAEPKALLDEAEKAFFSIFEEQHRNDITSISSVVDSVIDDLERISQRNGVPRGIPTGIPELDEILGGWQNGSLIVLAARPSVGKTALALFSAEHAARNEFPVMFFSLEMCREELVQRLLCITTGVNMGRIQQGWFAEGEVQKMRDASAALKALPISIDDAPHQSIWDIRSKSRRWKKHSGGGLVVIDYLTLMSAAGRQQRYIEVGEMSRGLKALAKELRCPVLTLSQLGRDADGQVPRLSQLRESGNIEQDADVVVFLHPLDKKAQDAVRRDEKREPGNIQCFVGKHRQGRRGHFYLDFEKKTQRFLKPSPGGIKQVSPVGVYDDKDKFDAHGEEQEEMF